MQFEFATSSRIIFGMGKLSSIGNIATQMGNNALIVSGVPKNISDHLVDLLNEHRIKSNVIIASAEPTVQMIRDWLEFARKYTYDLVIGIGGGSAIDSAKAIAALISNPGDITDYLEVIGLNKTLTNPLLPLIAIPTTAGTGSEVTRNAVIGSPEQHVKVSLRSPYLLPKVALVDPELTKSVPSGITAFTGLDALTQLIEPYTCNTPNPLTDALGLEGIKRIAQSLAKVYDDGFDLGAREDMSLASLFSGLALANAKLGAVHGLAGPIGGEISAPHGAICARLLPEVMEFNIKSMKMNSPTKPILKRYTEIGTLLTGDRDSSPFDAIQWVRNLCKHMNIQPLSYYGLEEAQFSSIIDKALISSSMRGNPVTLSDHELRNILGRALQP
jgi:alcohol dehydrogenase class IV